MPNTYSTNTTCDQSTDANYQAWVGGVIGALVTQLGLPQTADVCQLTTTNYNASVVVNAQTATNVLTVNSITSGGNNICIGMTVVGTSVPAGTYITAVGTGTGGTGTYTLSATVGTIAAESMTISLKAPTASNQNQGYILCTFNDTLQSTLPIYFKLEFGSGSGGANYPTAWITAGTGSNGSGTITTTGYTGQANRQSCGWAQSTGNASNYVSRYCYNATQGFLGVCFQMGQGNSGSTCWSFFIFRYINTAGAPTADGFMTLLGNYSSTGNSQGGYMTTYCKNNNVIYGAGTGQNLGPPTALAGWSYWTLSPAFNSLVTVIGGGSQGQVFPCYQFCPASATGPANIGITNHLALASLTEIPLGNTVSVNILGSTTLTYIAVVAGPFGYYNCGSIGQANSYFSLLMLWQ